MSLPVDDDLLRVLAELRDHPEMVSRQFALQVQHYRSTGRYLPLEPTNPHKTTSNAKWHPPRPRA